MHEYEIRGGSVKLRRDIVLIPFGKKAAADLDAEDPVLIEIASKVKDMIAACDAAAFSGEDTLWEQFCRQIEHGIIFR